MCDDPAASPDTSRHGTTNMSTPDDHVAGSGPAEPDSIDIRDDLGHVQMIEMASPIRTAAKMTKSTLMTVPLF
jgi:hypothetical protein